MAHSYALQTTRLTEIHPVAGYGCRLPAARLLERLALCVSDDTILRRITEPFRRHQDWTKSRSRRRGLAQGAGTRSNSLQPQKNCLSNGFKTGH